jgi:hypothetical protein
LVFQKAIPKAPPDLLGDAAAVFGSVVFQCSPKIIRQSDGQLFLLRVAARHCTALFLG